MAEIVGTNAERVRLGDLVSMATPEVHCALDSPAEGQVLILTLSSSR
jgi:hypothetical protein